MRGQRLLAAAALAALVCPGVYCACRRSERNKKPDAAEKASPTEVTTQGAIDVGAQHIPIPAVVGTITVGATIPTMLNSAWMVSL